MTGTVLYLCLLSTQEGVARYAHVNEIIKGLRDRGWSVELYEPSYSEADEAGPFRRIIEFVGLQVKLSRKLSDADAVYVRRHFAAFPTFLLAKLMGVPQVHEVNASHEDFFVGWPRARLIGPLIKGAIRAQLRWADAVITVTEELARWVEAETGREENVFVIPNAANTDLFRPDAETDLDLPDDYVVFFGLLAKWQGIPTLLSAVNEAEWPSRVSLVIVGGGPEEERVGRAARDSERVMFFGSQPYREMPGIVSGALASISAQNHLTGHAETGLFPLKVFESIACGVPVIVSDFPGMADLVRSSECGVVISPESPAELASAVRFLWENPETRHAFGKRAREVAEREHSWDARAADTHEVLQKCIAPSTVT